MPGLGIVLTATVLTNKATATTIPAIGMALLATRMTAIYRDDVESYRDSSTRHIMCWLSATYRMAPYSLQ